VQPLPPGDLTAGRQLDACCCHSACHHRRQPAGCSRCRGPIRHHWQRVGAAAAGFARRRGCRAGPRAFGLSAAAGAAATASASAAARWGCGAAPARHGDCGQEFHCVGVALGAHGGGGGFGHRPVQLEGVAAGAAAKIIARHGDRVWLGCDSSSPWLPGLWMTYRARSMGTGGRCRPVVSFWWRTGRTHPRSGAGNGLRRRILTGPSAAPARRLRRRFRRRARRGAMMPRGRLLSRGSRAPER
jgi:hypothetical protein